MSEATAYAIIASVRYIGETNANEEFKTKFGQVTYLDILALLNRE